MNPEEKLAALKYYMWGFVETLKMNLTTAKFNPHKIISFNDFIDSSKQVNKFDMGEDWEERGCASRSWENKIVGYLEYAKERGFTI